MFEHEVSEGAHRLDGTFVGWWLIIDLEKLDMTSRSCCVLGQLYGDYADGLHMTLDPWLCSSDYGFSLCGLNNHNQTDEWIALLNAWKAEIVKRLKPVDTSNIVTINIHLNFTA